MYIVRDKQTKNILHINNAPLMQNLDSKEVYFNFENETMEIGKTDFTQFPEHFDIDPEGYIIEASIEKLLEEGVIELSEDQEIVDGEIVEKTISKKIEENLIILLPHQKVIGTGSEERIVEKSSGEMVEEGLIELAPKQKIIKDSNGETQIVQKTLNEQLDEGLLKLGLNQRIVDNEIVTYTSLELYELEHISFEEYKILVIEAFSELSFTIRETVISEYKLINASLNVYEDEVNNSIKATVQAFRDEFHRLETAVQKATDLEAVQAINENYPREMIQPVS